MSVAKRQIMFRWLAVSLPFLALGLAEIILRLAGLGGYPPFVRDVGEWRGSRLMMVEPAATRPYFFAARERPGYADQSVFLMPKPANTFRIFLVGDPPPRATPNRPTSPWAPFCRRCSKTWIRIKKSSSSTWARLGSALFP